MAADDDVNPEAPPAQEEGDALALAVAAEGVTSQSEGSGVSGAPSTTVHTFPEAARPDVPESGQKCDLVQMWATAKFMQPMVRCRVSSGSCSTTKLIPPDLCTCMIAGKATYQKHSLRRLLT